ncbi:MAG: molybdopterin-dependent oxidoreductase, partial [Pseudorhodobacter sp.]|nr:molybdopterin-dependent oxidoreductase [Pseudorhodobacter sp.]
EGQICGGIQIGLGYALLEDVAVDPASGRVRGDSFARYTLANAPEMAPIRVLLVEEGEPTGPFGAKAVGEIATVPVAPAIVNAVNHALASALGDLPLTPARVLATLPEPAWLTAAS